MSNGIQNFKKLCSIFTKDGLSCFFSHQQLKLLHKEMTSRYGEDFGYIVSVQ